MDKPIVDIIELNNPVFHAFICYFSHLHTLALCFDSHRNFIMKKTLCP